MTTIDELLTSHASERPDVAAFSDGERSLSWRELEQRVAVLAGSLARIGVGRGDAIASRLADGPEWLTLFLAAVRLGAVIHLIDYEAGEEIWRNLLAAVDCRLLACDAYEAEMARRLAAASGGRTRLLLRGPSDITGEGDYSLQQLQQGEALPASDCDPESVVAAVYTSGSTGMPKRILRNHRQLAAEASQVAAAADLDEYDRLLCLAPFHHSFGFEDGVLLSLHTGATLLALPAGDGSQRPPPFQPRCATVASLTAVANSSVLLAVPYQYQLLASAPQLSGIRLAFSSGGALPESTFHHFFERHGVAIRSLYGSTEIGTVAFESGASVDPATVGQPLPGVQLVVVDQQGLPCPTGVSGRIRVASAVLADGYDGTPDQTAHRFIDGLFEIGDHGHIDRNGRLVIDGRDSRFLDVAGHKVDPNELEALIGDLPGVVEAAVVNAGGVEGAPLIALVVTSEESLSPLDERLTTQLSPHQRPTRLVRLDRLPRSATGKLQRPRLIEIAASLAMDNDRAVSDRDSDLRQLLESEAYALLQGRDPQAVPPASDRPLHEAGLRSLELTALRLRLEQRLGRSLPATLFFDYPTIEQVAGWLEGGEAPTATTTCGAGEDDEPLAIVAISCRFAGGIDSPEQLWQLLESGGTAIGPFPDNRGWPLDRLFDPDPAAIGKITCQRGGFLDDPARFDAALFGVSPREAPFIDPQQRVLMELAWEALERAGIAPLQPPPGASGVYLGLWSNHYGDRAPLAESADGYGLLGSEPSLAAGRIAYALGLEGPAMVVDTACSSSLTALHLACQALRAGECRRALVGAATIYSRPDSFLAFSRMQVLSPDGVCRPFDASANGAVWAEGAAMVVVERLEEARRHGHPVLALIRGSALNQDGRSQGITAPNGLSQQRVIEQALANAGVEADEIDVVEAHGTGTALGDPVEAGALIASYGRSARREPLLLGAVKANLGHTQAAAGLAGLIKLLLALQHERLPATANCTQPAAGIDWQGGRLEPLTGARPWRRGERPRRAGLSSFGMSGTNAHLILEEPPTTTQPPLDQPLWQPLILSAGDQWALRAAARRWADWLAGQQGADLAALKRVAAIGRSQLEWRALLDVEQPDSAIDALQALAGGQPHPAVTLGQSGRRGGGVVMLFSGHGSQWPGMGEGLLRDSPAFAAVIDECDRRLSGEVDWSLRDLLQGDGPSTGRIDQLQTLLFAIGVALAASWREAGVVPVAVAGHSVGEIAAAVVAGALSLADGLQLALMRSRLIASLEERGGMVAIQRPLAEVETVLAGQEQLTVAVVNGPGSVVVSGEESALEWLESRLTGDRIAHRRIAIGFAAHSRLMDRLLAPLASAIDQIKPAPSRIPFFSSIDGSLVPGEQLDSDYWQRNLRQPVRFDLTLSDLFAAGHRTFVEVSAHPLLTGQIARAAADGVLAIGTLRRDSGDLATLHRALATLYVHGCAIDWPAIFKSAPAFGPSGHSPILKPF